MSRYIKREELHCDNCCICRFKEELCDCTGEFCDRYKGIGNADDFMNAILANSSEDIVHCKECIHNGSIDTDCPFGWKDKKFNMPNPNDYCSYGERKEG